MNFLPVALLELRAASRHPMTYYSRCITALLAVSAGLGLVFAGFTRLMSAASAGQAVFCMMTGCAYVLLVAQAILLTCDCVSREKREGTLGLLFLTDLNGFDIVAGKLAAQAGRSLSCLLAVFPAFGFCILLGGVGPGDFAQVMLGLLNTLFYFAALGILISARVWRERAAAAWGGLALLILGALLPVLMVIIDCPALGLLIPAGAILAALGPAAGMASPPNVAVWMLASHTLGWIFIGAASYLVPRSVPRQPIINPVRLDAATRRKRASTDESPAWMTEPARPLLTTGLMAMICALILGAARFGPVWMTMAVVPITILFLHGVLKFQVASQASHLLAGKRRSGELELLLTTPCDEDEILRACLLGLKRSLFWPTVFALGVDSALLGYVFEKRGIEQGLAWTVAMVVEVIWLVANLYGLSWMGLYLGLKLANPAKAAGKAIFCVVLLPWVLFSFIALLAAMVVRGHRLDADFALPSLLIFLVVVTLCNTFFTGWAISELRDQFRTLAART